MTAVYIEVTIYLALALFLTYSYFTYVAGSDRQHLLGVNSFFAINGLVIVARLE